MRYFNLSFIGIMFITVTLHAQIAEIADPYLWLECNSPQTESWLQKQNELTQAYFSKFDDIWTEELERIYAIPEVSLLHKGNNTFYYLSSSPLQQQPCLYLQRQDGQPQLLIDPTQLMGEDTCAIKQYIVSPDEKRIAFGFSLSGSDEQYWQMLDIGTGRISEKIEGIKFVTPTWDLASQGIYYTPFDSNRIYHHVWGTDQNEDFLFYIHAQENICDFLILGLEVTSDGKSLIVPYRCENFKESFILLNLGDKDQQPHFLFPQEQAKSFKYLGEWSSRFYFIAEEEVSNGRILSVDSATLDNPFIHLDEQAECIEDVQLLADGNFAVTFLKEAVQCIKIIGQDGSLLKEVTLPGNGTPVYVSQRGAAHEFLYGYTDFLRPTQYYQFNMKTGESLSLFAAHLPWNVDDFEERRIHYPSKDGTLIPLTLVFKKGLDLSIPHPTLLFGYGGFKIALTPYFEPNKLLWMQNGGIIALANIRGGGEYGEAWHQAGRREKKQNVFDDFISAGEWLVQQKWTTASQLGISGRSNGGLLTAACLLQRPELFGAVLINVGVLDMVRYHKFTVGSHWIGEFGNPESEEDLPFILAYSPYHNVKELCYPPVLILTSDHDDRVVPLHSYKFAAILQSKQRCSLALLKVYQNKGHGPGRTYRQKIEEDCDFLNFMWDSLKISQLPAMQVGRDFSKSGVYELSLEL